MSVDDSAAKKEALSALMDGETDELELRRILRDVSQDEELAATWQRYNAAQAVLHGEIRAAETRPLSEQTHARIMAAVAAEPVADTAGKSRAGGRRTVLPGGWGQWKEGLGKAGIAASVALVFFVGMENLSRQGESGGPVLSQGENVAPGADSVTAGEEPEMLAAEFPDEEALAEAQRRLNEYIQGVSIQHLEVGEQDDFNLLEDSPLIRSVNQIQQ